MSDTLKSFTDTELLEELLRRKNASKSKRRPKHWCEDCQNFTSATAKMSEAQLEKYNPCSKGHVMDFYMPAEWESIQAGYYRRGCADRNRIQ